MADGHTGYKGNKPSYTRKTTARFKGIPLQTVEDVLQFKIVSIPERGITTKTAQHFGVRTEMSKADGHTPVAHYFPYTEDSKVEGKIEKKVVGYKKRDLTKHKKEDGHFTTIGIMKPEVVDLFGTDCGNVSGGKKVWTTEGEYDSMICYQAIKAEHSSGNPTVLSIGFGAPNAVKHIGQKHCMKYLNKFKEKVFAFDNDKASIDERAKGIMRGNEATAAVYGLIPDCTVAMLPDGKDPSEMFNDDPSSSELFWALMKPIKYKPEGFIMYSEIRDKAVEMPYLGKGWPWPTLFKKTLGRRLGEGYYIGAGVKAGKCFLKGTEVRMFDGSVKNVEDVVTGDEVMGWDSTKRTVLSTHSGRDEMYEVKQAQGKNYIVNSQHTLVLRDSGKKGQLVERSVEDLYNAYGDSNPLRDLKGFHSPIEYPEKPTGLDPYTLGVWMGDGSRCDNRLHLEKQDSEYILPRCLPVSLFESSKEGMHEGVITGQKAYFSSFKGRKYIPEDILTNSRRVRMEALAGWIDTDGHKDTRKGCSYEIITKDYSLALTGQELMRSLGLRVSVRQVEKGIKETGFVGKYYRMLFSGDLREVPIQVPRKKCTEPPKKDPTVSAVKLFHLKECQYYGFETDGDHKFVLKDYTVVHNSEFANKLIQYIIENEKDVDGNAQKVAVFKFEEEPDYTVKKVAGKFYKKDFTNPEKIIFIGDEGKEKDIYGYNIIDKSSFFTQEEMEYAVDTVGPNLVMYNAYGSCRWAELKGAIRHAVLVEHIVDIIIDPISRLTSGMTASEANQELEMFADEISKMSKDLGFTYYCFSHLKQPTHGPLHEFGGKVQSGQFTGSRAMTRCTYYTFGIERNKDPELGEKVFNTSYLVILDDRKHGRTAKIPMWYDSDTGDYIESSMEFIEDESCATWKEWINRQAEIAEYADVPGADEEF